MVHSSTFQALNMKKIAPLSESRKLDLGLSLVDAIYQKVFLEKKISEDFRQGGSQIVRNWEKFILLSAPIPPIESSVNLR